MENNNKLQEKRYSPALVAAQKDIEELLSLKPDDKDYFVYFKNFEEYNTIENNLAA